MVSTQSPSSLYTATNSHHANPTQNDSLFFHVNFFAKSKLFYHGGPAILDTGSNVTVVPLKQLQQKVVAQIGKITKTSNISGVGGKLQVVGYFDAELQLGDLVLPSIRFFVVY